MCLIEIGLRAQNMIAILSWWSTQFGGPIWPYNEYKNLHFDNEQDTHTSSEIYEEIGYSLDLDLLTIPY